MDQITVEQARDILNARRHRNCAKWYVCADRVIPDACDPCEELSHFEAVAVAEKYQRGTGEAGWRPIDTAPKDGTWILVFVPDSPMAWGPYELTCWITDYSGRQYWCEMDVSEELEGAEDITHWMPLPEPPPLA
jgi:hypothetical protein